MILTEPAITIGHDIDVARALFDRGDYKEAHALSMQVFTESADVNVRLRCLLTASSCRSEQRRYTDALAILNLGCPLLDGVGPEQKARFFGQRAYLHSKLKDEANILIDYEAARVYAREAGDRVTEAQVINNIAGCYRRLKRYDESLIESEAAIDIVRRSADRLLLARFYDQKAQTLVEMNRFAEAVVVSKKAVEILGDHPVGAEARTTHGRALIALGAEYLETDDLVETFRAKQLAVKSISQSPSPALMQLALDRVGGRVAQAAQLLGMKHNTLIDVIKRHHLTRKQPQRRGKSLELK